MLIASLKNLVMLIALKKYAPARPITIFWMSSAGGISVSSNTFIFTSYLKCASSVAICRVGPKMQR
jgi:hypothetical protein